MDAPARSPALFARPSWHTIWHNPARTGLHGAGPNDETPDGIRGLAEAPPGFEPGNRGFAVPCLTTWLRRRIAEKATGEGRRVNRSGASG
jgi:hypothetical protein